MGLSARSAHVFARVGGLAVLIATSGCIDIAGADLKYVEREEKHFTTTGKPDVALSTFDGAIEVRPWDKPEVQVVVEKRGRDQSAISTIDVRAEQSGDRITVDVRAQKHDDRGLHLRWFVPRSAKLIVSLPASANVSARSGDGSIDIERISGKVDLQSGDGRIRGRDLGGDVTAHTGDGSIKLDGVTGALNVDTGDGSIVVTGKLTAVRARTGDGSVTVRAESGSAATSDWDITTGDGSVTLELPEPFNGELDAHTGDGGIRLHDVTLSPVPGTDLPAHPRGDPSAKNTVRGRLGTGGSVVRVRTGDGSITVRKS